MKMMNISISLSNTRVPFFLFAASAGGETKATALTEVAAFYK
jgi:hypothetical protein